MSTGKEFELTGDALNEYLLKREALRRANAANPGSSPIALESALADLSAEMTAEALYRKQHPSVPT